MRDRFIAKKFGLLDFWHYDEQEYELNDGKIIFRGTNGSGKSVTTQSFIPLLLDGNKSPNRIDPFGTKSRRLENYLLMDEGQDEKISYLYLEFFKEDTNTYLTLGMGMRARKGRELDSWYFILKDGSRVGKDFKLYKESDGKYLLTSKELKNQLKDGNFFTTSQGEYMRKVNEHLYGYSNIDDYKDLLNLLIELRSPKLSKEFRPTRMYEILNKALGTLGEDDLLEVSEAMDNMEELQVRIKNSEEALAGSKKIEKVYDEYNKAVIYNKAKNYIDKNIELTHVRKNRENISDEIESEIKKLEEINSELVKIERENTEATSVVESLKENDCFSISEKITLLKKDVKNLIEKINLKENRKINDIAREGNLKKKIAQSEYEIITLEEELGELIEEEKASAEEIYFSDTIDFDKEIKDKKLNIKSFRYSFEGYAKLVDEIYDIISKYDYLEKDIEKYKETYYRVENDVTLAKKKVKDALEYLTNIKTEYSESINLYFDNAKEVKISDNEKITIHKKINSIEKIEDCYKLADYIKTSIKSKEDFDLVIREHNFKITDIKNSINDKNNEIANLKIENNLEDSKLLEFKKILDINNIEYTELFKCIEFGDNLELKQKQRLESALKEIGYLKALVIPRKFEAMVKEIKDASNYKYIIANDKEVLNNLSASFKVENNDFTKKYKEEIIQILKSISVSNSDIVVNFDDEYKLLDLSGDFSNDYELKYIGYQSRVYYLEGKKRKLLEEIEVLNLEIEKIEKEINIINDRKEVFEQELKAIPSIEDVEKTIELIRESENEFRVAQDRHIEVKNTMSIKVQEFDVIKLELFEKKDYVRIPNKLNIYDGVRKEIHNYRNNLNKIDESYNKLINTEEVLKVSKSELEHLSYNIEEQMGEIAEFNLSKEEKEIQINTFEKRLEELDMKSIVEKLESALNITKSYADRKSKIVGSIGALSANIKNKNNLVLEIDKKIAILEDEETFVKDIFKQERGLGYIENLLEEDVYTSARLILKNENSSLLGRTEEFYKKLLNIMTNNKGALVDYNLMEKTIFTDENSEYESEFKNIMSRSKKRGDIFLTLDGRRKNIKEFNKLLQMANEELGVLINEEEKKVLENTLIKTLSTKISGKIYNAQNWVKKINKLMNGLNTSNGLKLKLQWIPKKSEGDGELNVKELYRQLQEADFMSDKDRSMVANHFKIMLKKEKRIAHDKGEDSSYKSIIRNVLDYRKWFEFKLEHSMDRSENYKELTDNAFFRLSGGEKAMSMYIPLFAAVNSRYARAEKRDCPRIIALDEAFAGVDDDNIREMFSLLESLDLDYVLNSQVLWGTYDSVKNLAIYEIIRYDEEVIVPIRYEWNGKVKTTIGS